MQWICTSKKNSLIFTLLAIKVIISTRKTQGMASNKNAIIRYKVLDKCFRNVGKKYYIDKLIEECSKVLTEINPNSGGISRRQIYDDIAFMESEDGWSIDLLRIPDGRRVYYRYADPNFSIDQMPLNAKEIHQLQSAMDILAQFDGLPHFEWLNQLIPRLTITIGSNTSLSPIISFDNNEYLTGKDFLKDLYQAIRTQQVLKVLYQPFFQNTPLTLLFHPYYIKQYNKRWFAFGYNPEKNKHNWTIALDRIVSIETTNDTYLSNDTIDWNEYFEDIIGVTKPEGKEVENIVLHFDRKTARYIETKPIHGSQKVRWVDENTLEVSVYLIINYEFERYILSYGDSVKVIKPTSLADVIHLRLQNASNQYLVREKLTLDNAEPGS